MSRCCCGEDGVWKDTGHETLRVPRSDKECGVCDDYVRKNRAKPIVVISCEGACLRGEISRRVANVICHELAPDVAVRICQGSALSKDGGQRHLVVDAEQVVFLEGCEIQCASRLFDWLEVAGKKTVIYTDRHADFDQALFGSDEVSNEETDRMARSAADEIMRKHFGRAR